MKGYPNCLKLNDFEYNDTKRSNQKPCIIEVRNYPREGREGMGDKGISLSLCIDYIRVEKKIQKTRPGLKGSQQLNKLKKKKKS